MDDTSKTLEPYQGLVLLYNQLAILSNTPTPNMFPFLAGFFGESANPPVRCQIPLGACRNDTGFVPLNNRQYSAKNP